MHLESLDIGFIILYLSILLVMGVVFIFRANTPERFMVGERSMPGVALGLSNAATQNSSIAFLLMPAAAYNGDWSMVGMLFAIPIIGMIVSRYIVPFFRQRGDISAYSYLHERFGGWAMIYSVILFVLSRMMRCGLIVYYLSVGLAPLTGFDEKAIILVTGVVVTFYTYMGGLVAVVWTEVMQAVVLFAGLITTLFFICYLMPGGATQILDIATQMDKMSLGSWDFDLVNSSIWVAIIFGFTADLQEFSFSQMFVQRYIAAKSDEDAKISVWMGLVLSGIIVILFYMIGTALYAFYQVHPTLLPETGFGEKVSIYAYFIGTQMPVGMTGMMIIAFLAASMGSIDSNLISTSTVFFCNVYKPYFKRGDLTNRSAMKILHWSSLAVGLVAILIAFGFSHVERHALDVWYKIMGVLYGGVLGLFLMGMGSKKIGNKIAITAIVVGSIVILWIGGGPYIEQVFEGYGVWQLPLNALMSLSVGTLVILGIGFGLSLFVKENPEQ